MNLLRAMEDDYDKPAHETPVIPGHGSGLRAARGGTPAGIDDDDGPGLRRVTRKEMRRISEPRN